MLSFRMTGDKLGEGEERSISVSPINTKRLPAGDWTHIVVAYDGSGGRAGLSIYQNGDLVEAEGSEFFASVEGSVRTARPLLLGNGIVASPPDAHQTIELSDRASALGLYAYGKEHPGAPSFHRFHATAVSVLEAVGVEPTYIGVEGPGYSGEYTRYGGRTHKRLLASDFSGVSVLALVSNPAGSDEPSYDSFASASLSYVEALREVMICFVVNESYMRLGTEAFDEALRNFIDLLQWDVGYGFSAGAARHPDFYLLGLDDRQGSPDERAALRAWYAARPETRIERLRDVHRYTILNERQLNKEIQPGTTLREFILEQGATSFTRLTDYGLHLWSVPEESLPDLRGELRRLSMLIR